jgi:hypothetical protein
MVDRDLVLRKLSDLDEYENQLLEFKGLTVKQYRLCVLGAFAVNNSSSSAISACSSDRRERARGKG